MQIGQEFVPYRLFTGSYVPTGLMQYTGISASAKLVWARLARYAGDRGIAWPSAASLARECGLSGRTCQRALAELEAKSFIIRKGMRGQQVVYAFLMHETLAEPTTQCHRSHAQDESDPTTKRRTERKPRPTTDKMTQDLRQNDVGTYDKMTHNMSHVRESKEESLNLLPSPNVGRIDAPARASPQASLLAELWDFWNCLWVPGVANEADCSDLQQLIEEHGAEAVSEALQECQKYHKLRRAIIPYAAAMLRRKDTDGRNSESEPNYWR